jgi:hypothetical protein
MPARFDDFRHLLRLLLLFLAGLAAFLLLRAVLMPPGFGDFGHYRAGALDDNRLRPVTFAGQRACLDCHGDVGETRAGGRHERLSCEGCHGAMASHASDPTGVAAARPDPRSVCLRCHARNRSRPASFPQIVVDEHAGDASCADCHRPHHPGIS